MADTVLHFEYGMRIMVVAQWCFSSCWAVLTLNQGLFSFLHQRGDSRGTRNWERTLPGQLTPNGQRDIPDTQCIKGGESWPGAAFWELSGHGLVGEEQLHGASLVLYILIILFLLLIIISNSFSVLLSCLYLNSGILLFFPNSVSHPTVWGKEAVPVWCLIVTEFSGISKLSTMTGKFLGWWWCENPSLWLVLGEPKGFRASQVWAQVLEELAEGWNDSLLKLAQLIFWFVSPDLLSAVALTLNETK